MSAGAPGQTKASMAQVPDVVMSERGLPPGGVTNMKASDLMECLKIIIPKFSGSVDKELISAETSALQVESECAKYRQRYEPEFFRALILGCLTGDTARELEDMECDTPEAILNHLRDKYNSAIFQFHLIQRIESGSVFQGCTQ
ncbi:hypothetical protein H4R24_001481, partial [Coemansia sp. RSA 988]